MSRSTPVSELSARERAVLSTVIRGYVTTAAAVGSRWVARGSGLGLSPASIRNCMMDLEEKGLLTHLHTSGGRLPTNAGYRLFVNELMQLPAIGKRQARAVDEALGPASFGSLEALLDQACVILGQLSEQLSVILSPRYDKSVLERIELSQVDARCLLVVFRMSSGLERTVVVGLDREIRSDDLRDALQTLNPLARGRTLAEVIALRDDGVTRVRVRGLALAAAVWQGAEELRSGELKDHFHLWGAQNILAQPEFEDRERLRGVFRALEEREVLHGLFEPTRHRRNVCITIGDENPVPELRNCSVVAVSYRFGEFGGSVGVIGPTRMPYERIVSLVDYVARSVGRVLVRN
jgi:heat-inducible transcriptional repressor